MTGGERPCSLHLENRYTPGVMSNTVMSTKLKRYGGGGEGRREGGGMEGLEKEEVRLRRRTRRSGIKKITKKKISRRKDTGK